MKEIELSDELMGKLKEVKSEEELLQVLKANDINLSKEEEKELFARVNSKISELEDEVLGDVSGGRRIYPV
jgi:hypothetical protein